MGGRGGQLTHGAFLVRCVKSGSLLALKNLVQNLWKILLCCLVVVWSAATSVAQTALSPHLISLVELQSVVTEHGGAAQSFQTEGVVCAVVRERRLLALQDKTATVLLELPAVDDAITVGDQVIVRGTTRSIFRGRFGIRISTAVVNNDQLHSAQLKAGNVFLQAGLQPIRLEWFNGWYDSALALEYAGPGVLRQKVSDDLLWRKPTPGTVPQEFQPGLDFAAYNGDWNFLPDFADLTPVAKGVATNFSLAYCARTEHTALVFSGFIKISKSGVYIFYLTSDDGSRLEVGRPEISCSVVPGSKRSVPATETFDQALADQNRCHWIELNGEVTFAGENQGNLEMDLVERENHLPVTVINGAALLSTNLLHRRIRVEGIGEFSYGGGEKKFAGLVVPSVAQIKIYPSVRESFQSISSNDLLMTVAQVRRLKPEQARLGIAVKITGVVIAASAVSLVLQDTSGGVFIHFDAGAPSNQPAVGQFWEIEGRTDAGDFSPVILAGTAKYLGGAAMPEPIRPTRDQVMNGSLDAEYVELHGVVTAISNAEMTVLTPDGKVTVMGDVGRPLPQMSASALAGGLVGNIVRLRGCFTADWNAQTRQVIGGSFFLYPAVIEVEKVTPKDPFSLPASRAADLLWFDARASALQRTKLEGLVIHVRPGEYFLLDQQTGVRVLTAQSQPLQAGDLIEAVGFPHLGGSSPVLQEAQVRKTGHAPLPEPVQVSSGDLLNPKHDSTLVQVQAFVISDALQMNRRVLELQAGPHHFLATLNVKGETSIPFSPGSRLQLTGVYSSAREDMARDNLDSFELFLNNAADISVLQQPPWWTVRRAITVATVLAGGFGITLIWIMQLRRKVEERTTQLQKEIEERQRIEQKRVMEQERTRIAQDLHDELGVGLTQVGILGSLAKNPALPTERKNLYLEQLSEAARTLVTGLDEVVWAVNPKYDSVSSLASYYALFTQRFLNLAGIACRFDATENLQDYPLDSRLRHGIFLAFKEALNNVVRHSGATEVLLTITIARDQLMITITDNGRGFAGSPGLPGSDGLAGMRQRMEKLGGQCVINSQLGQGTMVELNLPLGKNGA
jgi:signal transduction histidine kinase